MREITWMKATHEALSSAMAADPTIFVMGEGIGKRGGNFRSTEGLYDIYGPLRLCDTPICERGFVGLASGHAPLGQLLRHVRPGARAAGRRAIFAARRQGTADARPALLVLGFIRGAP